MTYNTTRDNVRGAKKISSGKNNSKLQIKRIISIDKLLENIENGEEFVKMYGTNQTFENFSDPCYNQTFKNTFKNFSNSCYFISKNRITSATIANFVNEGAKLNFSNEKDRDTFISIAKQIGQLIVNQEIKLDSFKPQELANTFNGLGQCGVNLGGYVKDKFIGTLVGKIQTLLEEFNSIDIANTFNGLAKCGVNLDGYIDGTFIGALVGRIQTLLNETDSEEQFNSIGIANTFNGLAKCDVNLYGYVNNDFIRALVGRIQTLLEQEQFTSQHIANTFNGLGQCGVNLGGYVKDKFIETLVGKIQTLLEEFNSIGIANTFNGLAKCGVNLGTYLNSLNPKDKNKFIGDLVGKIQTLLEEFNSIGIANTFNGLGQCGVNLGGYVKDKFIGTLVGKIQTLLEEFNSIDIANTFNGLAKCGVNLGEYVNNDFIRALVNRIQVLLNKKDYQIRFNFKPQELANTFNGLAKCGINLGEYIDGTFIEALVGRIQNLLEDFNSIDIANTFNGLAKCGVNLGGYFETEEGKDSKNAFIRALVGEIQNLLKEKGSQIQFNFKSKELANTSNGLVSLFLYNEVLYEKNISHFKDIINILVQKYFKQLNRDDRSDWAMLYNIKYLQVYGFNDVILSEIETNLKSSYLNDDYTLKLDALNDDHTNSALEENFKAFLENFRLKNKKAETLETKDGYYESQSKLTFLVTSHVSFERLIDFYIEFIQDNKTYKAYIELDGPTHFTDTKQTQRTPQTQIRDILTLKQLQEEQAKADDNTQILYVTLSAKEFDEIKKNITTEKEDLIKFLVEQDQLQQTAEKTSDNSKIAVEYKSIYDSVNDVASKTTDIDDYTTPTPGQAVSELAQKAQQDDGWITVKSNYKGKPKDKKTKTKTKSRKISIK